LAPCLLDQKSDALLGDATKLNLQPEETPPRIHASYGLKRGGIGRRRAVRFVLADAEQGRLLVLAHAEKCPPPDFEDRDVKPEMTCLVDLGQSRRPTPNVIRGDHLLDDIGSAAF
jgi:hypothetical protein